MSIINQGAQKISFDYKEPLKGSEFNKTLRDLAKPGIYQGGTLTRIDDVTVRISPFVAYVNVDTNKVVRIQTASTVDVIVSPSSDLVYVSYEWLDVIENWADFSVRSSSDSPAYNEVAFGKCIFAGSVLTGFDTSHSYRDTGLLDDNYNVHTDDIIVNDDAFIGGDALIGGRLDVYANSIISGELKVKDEPLDMFGVGNQLYNDRRYLLKSQGFDSQFADLQAKISTEEIKNMEQEIRIGILEGRQYQQSDMTVELYMDQENVDDYENSYNQPVEICSDNEWNLNWKYNSDGTPDFKQGYMRPRRQPYMMETIDLYQAEGVGQLYKQGIKYDSTNQCYWMMSSAGENAIGEITKLSNHFKDNKGEVLGRWYLTAQGASTGWTGIASDGSYLYISYYKSANSQIMKIKINSDGTLGLSSVKTGETLNTYVSIAGSSYTNSSNTATCTSTATLRVGMRVTDTITAVAGTVIPNDTFITEITNATTFKMSKNYTGTTGAYTTYISEFTGVYADGTSSSLINDIEIFDSTTICYLLSTSATAWLLKFVTTSTMLVNNAVTYGGHPTAVGSLAFGTFIGITSGDQRYRSIAKNGNDLYIKVRNITTTLYPWIFKFDLVNDVYDSGSGHTVIKSSGRFEVTRSVAQEAYAGEGICFGHTGDIYETVSTASYGRFIARRALKGALWAENQVSLEYKFNSSVLPTTPLACMSENSRYLWTADHSVTANEVDIFRFDTQTGLYKHARLTNQTWNALYDLTNNPNTDVLYLLGHDGTNWEVFFGDLSDFVALMGNTYNTGNTISIGSAWGTIASGIGASNTNNLRGICYDSDSDIITIINDTDDKIDTLSLDGVTWTQGVYDLPSPSSAWIGLAYKNGKFYTTDSVSTMRPIYVIDKTLSTSSWLKLHQYQDPCWTAVSVGTQCLDFMGNDLVSTHYTHLLFNNMKTLEDPNVLQLHSFIEASNSGALNPSSVLLSNNVAYTTPIIERYFAPEQFSDPRNIPDQFYAGVCYGDSEGFSILHLDEFLNDFSSAGLPRYDVRKIRMWHYKSATGNIIGPLKQILENMYIEKELIIVTGYYYGASADTYPTVTYVDLKNDKAMYMGYGNDSSQISGQYYNGSNNRRNDGLGKIGTTNTDLNLSFSSYVSSEHAYKPHAKTFFKEDPSDYNEILPKTFVAMSTSVGCDLLVIDWDENGNRTPVKVYNNVFNLGITQNGHKILDNGMLIGQYAADNTSLYTVSEISIGSTDYREINYASSNVRYVWNMKKDAIGYRITTLPEIQSNPLLSDYQSYKTTSGQWKNRVVRSTYAVGRNEIDCLEDLTREYTFYIDNSTIGYGNDMIFKWNLKMWEDKFFANYGDAASTDYYYGFLIMNKKKLKRFTLDSAGDYTINGWGNMFEYSIQSLSRPYFDYITGGAGKYTIGTFFSQHFNIAHRTSYANGLLWLHLPQLDNCYYETIDKELTTSPSQLYYKEDVITPFNDKYSECFDL